MKIPATIFTVGAKRGRSADLARAAIPFFLLLLLVTIIGIFRPGFLAGQNLLEVIADTGTLFVLASGLTFVVILGGIDLSIHTVASLSSVIVAVLLSKIGYWVFPFALVIGFAIGAFSGIIHVWLKIPSFIATLATSGLVAAAALVLSQARAITVGEHGRTYLEWITNRVFGIPCVILIGAVVALLGIFLQRYTAFGRYSIAIGAGESATWAAGVQVNKIKVLAYSLSAGLGALAGIILCGRATSGSPTLASELLLPAISAVVVGGTAVTGGAGGITRTLIGALIVSVVRVGMTFLGVNIFAQQMVFGAVLVMAVAITIDRRKVLIVK
jgi:ribose transport system permease protein